MSALERHIATITGTDGRGYIEGLRIAQRMEAMERQHKDTHFEPVRRAVAQVKRTIRDRLHPHRIEWSHGPGFHVSGIDGSVHLSLSCEIWPALPGAHRYLTHIRAPIRVNSLGARDAAELEHICAGLREAADRLAAMMFTPSGPRAAQTEDPA